MRSTLNARSAILAEVPKGALFLLKRYGHQPIFGIKLSEPLDQPNGKPTVLILGARAKLIGTGFSNGKRMSNVFPSESTGLSSLISRQLRCLRLTIRSKRHV